MAAVTAKHDTPPADAVPGPPPRQPGVARAFRIAMMAACLVIGLAVGTVGSFFHRAELGGVNGSGGFPDGLLLSLGALVAILLVLGEFTAPAPPPESPVAGRLGALGSAAAGWVVAVMWLAYVGPPWTLRVKGDAVVANDWRSIAFLIAGMALATAFLYKAWIATLDVRLRRAGGKQ